MVRFKDASSSEYSFKMSSMNELDMEPPSDADSDVLPSKPRSLRAFMGRIDHDGASRFRQLRRGLHADGDSVDDRLQHFADYIITGHVLAFEVAQLDATDECREFH